MITLVAVGNILFLEIQWYFFVALKILPRGDVRNSRHFLSDKLEILYDPTLSSIFYVTNQFVTLF